VIRARLLGAWDVFSVATEVYAQRRLRRVGGVGGVP